MSAEVWLDHRAAIDCYGREFVDGWTGAETLARGPLSYNADVRRILVDVPDNIAAKAYDNVVEVGKREASAALENPVTNNEKPCVICVRHLFWRGLAKATARSTRRLGTATG